MKNVIHGEEITMKLVENGWCENRATRFITEMYSSIIILFSHKNDIRQFLFKNIDINF